MALQQTRSETETGHVTVARPMNDHGGMTLPDDGAGAQYHVVEYRYAELRETLEALPRGATVPVERAPVRSRGNAWRAVGLGED